MKIRYLAVALALLGSLTAGTAFAQSTPTSVIVTATPMTTSVSPGSSVALGTVMLSSSGGSFTVNSVPVTLQPGGGALSGNLTNCQLFNSNTTSTSTTSGLGSAINPVNGANAFALSAPVTVTSTSPVTLQIRCDVSSAAPTNGTFQFLTSTSTATGAPTSGATLSAEAEFVKQVPAGLTNAIIGVITLDATHSSQAVSLNALPISVSASGGATLSSLSNCLVTSTTGTVLTTGGNAISAITGANTFNLDTPLTIAAGQGALLVLRCDVSANAPTGGMLTVGLAPSSFKASANGAPVTVMQGLLSTGQPGTNSGVISVGAPGSATSGVGTPATPGVPNTGAGGDAAITYSILAASLIAFALAMKTLLRRRQTR